MPTATLENKKSKSFFNAIASIIGNDTAFTVSFNHGVASANLRTADLSMAVCLNVNVGISDTFSIDMIGAQTLAAFVGACSSKEIVLSDDGTDIKISDERTETTVIRAEKSEAARTAGAALMAALSNHIPSTRIVVDKELGDFLSKLTKTAGAGFDRVTFYGNGVVEAGSKGVGKNCSRIKCPVNSTDADASRTVIVEQIKKAMAIVNHIKPDDLSVCFYDVNKNAVVLLSVSIVVLIPVASKSAF
jgi:hypothetical protein